jgi:hypothetical protein
MPMLGDLLAAARDSAGGFDAWLNAADPHMALRVREAASANAVAPTAFVRMSVADFSRFAAEEDWSTLISGMRDSDDPGMSCLYAMVDWRLAARACTDHQLVAERTGE